VQGRGCPRPLTQRRRKESPLPVLLATVSSRGTLQAMRLHTGLLKGVVSHEGELNPQTCRGRTCYAPATGWLWRDLGHIIIASLEIQFCTRSLGLCLERLLFPTRASCRSFRRCTKKCLALLPRQPDILRFAWVFCCPVAISSVAPQCHIRQPDGQRNE